LLDKDGLFKFLILGEDAVFEEIEVSHHLRLLLLDCHHLQLHGGVNLLLNKFLQVSMLKVSLVEVLAGSAGVRLVAKFLGEAFLLVDEAELLLQIQ